MLYKKKNKNLIKNIISRKYNKLISKRNNNIVSTTSNVCLKNLYLFNILNNKKILKKKKICVDTSRYSSVNKNLNLTRQIINKESTLVKLDNIKIYSW